MGTPLQEQARALGDPTRHAIFRYVCDAERAVDVAELTRHFGLNHNAIRQHLAKLVHAGLVLEAKASGGGPGRPRLLYELDPTADSRWGVVGPYERLAVLLAETLRSGREAREVGQRQGADLAAATTAAADPLDALSRAMARQGFAPEIRRRGDRAEIVLHECPFASAALADPTSVCGLHLGLAEGLVEGTGLVVEDLVRKDPRRAGCRLHVHLESPS